MSPHPRQCLLACSGVQEGQARAAREEVFRRLAHLVPHRVHHLGLDHRMAAHEPPAQPALLGDLGHQPRLVAIGGCKGGEERLSKRRGAV